MPAKTEISLPHEFEARDYQKSFLHAMETDGMKRAVCVWHRRAGKDKVFLNFMIPRMFERVGAYYYYFPTAAMGRDVLWQGMDRKGFRFMDHFPPEIIARKSEQTMMIELLNGSIFKIRGTDRTEPIGVNPVGVVFSEFSRQDPRAGWDLVRPILAENAGWSVFNFTPRGKNHAYRLYQMARENPDWFCELLSVDDTHAISYDAIEADRSSGMSEEMVQQEYWCSFTSGVEGSYYGRLMEKARDDGRVGAVPYDTSTTVYTFWDLGIGDSTAIWFVQFVRQEIRLIDYYEARGEGIAHYAKVLQERPYVYAEHYGPHDLQTRSLQTGTNLLDTARQLGLNFHVLPQSRVEDGIEAVRGVLPLCWFDSGRCREGIDALENYHTEFQPKRESFSQTPCHDFASHGADAMRYMAMAYRYHLQVDGQRIGYPRPLRGELEMAGFRANDEYDPLGGVRRRRG